MTTMTMPAAALPAATAAANATFPMRAVAGGSVASAATAVAAATAGTEAAATSATAAAAATTARPASSARLSPAALRERRAAIAQRLLDLAPGAIDAIDWDALDRAPDWLALPDASFLILQARLGALLHLPAMRLWIDGPRLAATRVLLGEAVLDDLMSHPESAMPFGLTPCARIESATQVGPALRACGASVLLAALPRGPLRDALCRGLAPVEPSRMSPELAETLIVRARHMGGPRAGGAA
jgi:hypothetical protein